MADNWDDADDDDDDWDQDDDVINAKLGLKTDHANKNDIPKFDDEQDLAVAEKALREKTELLELKKKGTALQEKKALEKERLEAVELAKKAMELEAELEANLSPEELKALKQRQIEEADHALTDDLFDNVDNNVGPSSSAAASTGVAAKAGDKVVMKDLVDHLKHARKVAECCKAHGKIHLTLGFLKECLEQCKDVVCIVFCLDDEPKKIISHAST
jgi:translation initiation factor 3 subunit J